MKEQNIMVDITRLNSDQLKQLAAMIYETTTDMNSVKQINERIAFVKGWMSEKEEMEYIKKHL